AMGAGDPARGTRDGDARTGRGRSLRAREAVPHRARQDRPRPETMIGIGLRSRVAASPNRIRPGAAAGSAGWAGPAAASVGRAAPAEPSAERVAPEPRPAAERRPAAAVRRPVAAAPRRAGG